MNDKDKELLKAVAEKLKDRVLFPERIEKLRKAKFVFKMSESEELAARERYSKDKSGLSFNKWLKEEKIYESFYGKREEGA